MMTSSLTIVKGHEQMGLGVKLKDSYAWFCFVMDESQICLSMGCLVWLNMNPPSLLQLLDGNVSVLLLSLHDPYSLLVLMSFMLFCVSIMWSSAVYFLIWPGYGRHIPSVWLLCFSLSVWHNTLLCSHGIWYMPGTLRPKLSLIGLSMFIVFFTGMWVALILCLASNLLFFFEVHVSIQARLYWRVL